MKIVWLLLAVAVTAVAVALWTLGGDGRRQSEEPPPETHDPLDVREESPPESSETEAAEPNDDGADVTESPDVPKGIGDDALVSIPHADIDPAVFQVREIPLKEIHATVGYEGVRDTRLPRELSQKLKDYSWQWSVDRSKGIKRPYDVVMLVTGDDIREAKESTVALFGRDEAPRAENYWLFVYTGANDIAPPDVVARSARVDGRTIRFAYEYPKWNEGDLVSPLMMRYCFWIPLGNLEPGDYTVERIVVNKRQDWESTFTHRFTIPRD